MPFLVYPCLNCAHNSEGHRHFIDPQGNFHADCLMPPVDPTKFKVDEVSKAQLCPCPKLERGEQIARPGSLDPTPTKEARMAAAKIYRKEMADKEKAQSEAT